MMKAILLSILLILSCLTVATAQPTLTHNCNPEAGLQQHFIVGTAASAPGAQGPNITWDFSSATGTDIDFYFASCATSKRCGLFPGTNLTTESLIDTPNVLAWTVDQNRLAINGMRLNGINFVYSDPMEILRYPFTYNNSYTDSFVCDFTSGSPFNRRGAISVEADGYGTLMLPHTTYQNVLRVKTVESFADFTMGIAFATYETISYFWYAPDKKDFIAKHALLFTSGQQASETFHYTRTYPTGVSEITDIDASLNVFPNPATDLVRIHFNTATNKDIQIKLFDPAGRLVLQARGEHATAGTNEIKLNTAGVTQGIYFLNISTESESLNRKIEIR